MHPFQQPPPLCSEPLSEATHSGRPSMPPGPDRPQASLPRGEGSLSGGLTSSKCGRCQGEGPADMWPQVTTPLTHPLSHPLMWADESYHRPRCGPGWSLRSPSDISYDLARCEARGLDKGRVTGQRLPRVWPAWPEDRGPAPLSGSLQRWRCGTRGPQGRRTPARPRPRPMRSVPFRWV